MAKSENPKKLVSGKRINLMDDPPTASSSDEDEVETSIGEGEEVEGDSSSEEEEEDDVPSRNLTVKNPETPLTATKNHQHSDLESDREEENDSGSETERKTRVPNPVKSVTETKDSAVKNQDSKKGKSSTKSASKKRASETDVASKDEKKVKRVSGEEEKKNGGEETKKTYFQRVWSEDDEIVVLQGMIDYKTDTGVSPYDDINKVYQLVKKSVGFDVTRSQFTEKLRGLKRKFENNVGKGKNGEDPIFSKPHDRKAFELSKCIWGANGIAPESAVKVNDKSKKSKSKKVESVKQELVSALSNGKNVQDEVTNKGEVSSLGNKGEVSSLGNKGEVSSLGNTELDTTFATSFLVKSLARFGVDDLAANQGWTKLASEDKKRFEEQWNAIQHREFELYSQKTGFVREVLAKMAETFKPNP